MPFSQFRGITFTVNTWKICHLYHFITPSKLNSMNRIPSSMDSRLFKIGIILQAIVRNDVHIKYDVCGHVLGHMTSIFVLQAILQQNKTGN